MKVKRFMEKSIRRSVKTVERSTAKVLRAVDKAVDKAVEVVESAVQEQTLQKGARRVLQTVELGALRAVKTVQKHVAAAKTAQPKPPQQQQQQQQQRQPESSTTTTTPSSREEPRVVTAVSIMDNDNDTTTTYDVKFFTDWIDSLQSKLEPTLPALSQQTAFLDACQAVQSCHQTKVATENLLQTLSQQQQPPATAEELAQAQAAVDAATKALQNVLDTCVQVAADILDERPAFTKLVSADDDDKNDNDNTKWDDSDLITLVILQQAGAQRLADWCQTNDGTTSVQQLLDFLQHDISLQREFLQAGGAAKGEYGRAIQLYHQLYPTAGNHVVLQRLAMAVALELATPHPLFGRPHQFINPHARYVHYEQAFLFGELDPAFETLTVWELRNVVNSDATEEELGWGRQCLANYRPDLCYMDDAQWRYCRIVRTDVAYKDPEWYKQPQSYDQILAGGGKCGPRAWYGRFACKCFGIPTWGVQQPGHAAMSRWTANGWVICLGAGFQWSFWEGRCGLDFELETQARNALLDDDAVYFKKVMRLEYISYILGEFNTTVLVDCLPSPSSPWSALALMQRKRLVRDGNKPGGSSSSSKSILVRDTSRTVWSRNNKVQAMMVAADDSSSSAVAIQEATAYEDGTIIIPAASTSKPTEETRQILFPRSFLGGRQLVLQVDSSVEYTLTPDMIWRTTTSNDHVDDDTPTTPTKYQLTLRVCTVHRHEEPLLVTISSSSNSQQHDDQKENDKGGGDDNVVTYKVEMPYTMGMWDETKPVTVVMGGPGVTLTKLTLARQTNEFAISIKDIKLVPVASSRAT